MINENNKKIPCGGFYLGGGFGINENTLVCNNYLKINQTTITEEGFKISYEISPDSPLKNVEDVMKQIENGSIFILISENGKPVTLFAPNDVSILKDINESESFEIILSRMYVQGVLNKIELVKESYTLKSDNSITVSSSSFTLTKES